MPTRNVVLTAQQAEMIERLVGSGRYQNASEVLREGLRLVEQRDAEDKARLKALRQAARRGIADIDNGRFETFTDRAALERFLRDLGLTGPSVPTRRRGRPPGGPSRRRRELSAQSVG